MLLTGDSQKSVLNFGARVGNNLPTSVKRKPVARRYLLGDAQVLRELADYLKVKFSHSNVC